MLVVSRDIQLRCHIGAEIIKSPAWTTTLSLLQGAAPLMPKAMEFILLHMQHNFYRCSHTGSITTSTIIIMGECCAVNRNLLYYVCVFAV